MAPRPGSPSEPLARAAAERVGAVPSRLEADLEGLRGRVLHRPARSELEPTIREQLIVELHSRR